MNPSGAPSLIERFTSLVSHVTELMNAVQYVVQNQNVSEPIPGHAMRDQGQYNQHARASANARLNYQLG